MDFYVRYCINQNFAKEKKEKNEIPAEKLTNKLGHYVKETILSCYLTFGLIKVSDKNYNSCIKRVKDAWFQIYPENYNALDLMVIPANDNDPVVEVLKIMYTAYFGWENYLKLCTDIFNVLPTFKEYNAMSEFRLQNYLLSIDSGYGISTMFSSFSDFLTKAGAFDNPQTVYTEYAVGKETKDGYFTTEDIFLALNEEANFYQLVGIDISYFLDKTKYDDFRKFIIRLSKLQDYYIFVFRVPYLEKKALNDVRTLLSDLMAIKEIIIEPYNDIVYYECLMNEMWSRNLSIDDGVYDVFLQKITEEKNDGRFYGFKTAYKVISEIFWEKIKSDVVKKQNDEKIDKTEVSASDISGVLLNNNDKEINGYEELSLMIGMEKITEKIKEIVTQVKIASQNNTLEKPCMHMRFLGNPGTGKTTVARIIGKIFKEEGILRKGSFFEHMARNLCGEFIGQTAPKTFSICRDAYGSVLFIDEAYSLYQGNDSSSNDYGKEALTTLVAEMENHRDDMVVIMAGYTDDMNTLMEGNAGLRSRMPFVLEFPNYTKEQLYEIFMSMVKKHFKYEQDFADVAKSYFDNISDNYIESKEFANARFVRNLYERTWSKAALRTSFSGEGELTLRKDDFVFASQEKEFSEKLMEKRKIGF